MAVHADWWVRAPFAGGDDSAESRLRRDAGRILRAALSAVDPDALVKRALEADESLAYAGSVRLLAVGKAATAMTRGALAALGSRVTQAVIARPGSTTSRDHAEIDGNGFTIVDAGHPLPDAASVFAARRTLRLVRNCRSEDLLLCLLSGGGSALMALPPNGVTLEDLRQTGSLLLRAGANIDEINAVRKHTDLVKGGRLARASTCPVLVLALSDVIGDASAVIASGPFSADPTRFADAIAVLRRYAVWDRTPTPVRRHLRAGARGLVAESPREEESCFARVDYRVIGSADTAAAAAADEARSLGYRSLILTRSLNGEARVAGRRFAALAHALRRDARLCLITAGETTVAVRGGGKGGRNQELAAAAGIELDGISALLASVGTDGIDGPTDAAGAVATGTTLTRARTLALDPLDALARNDTYPFFHTLGDLVRTGPTGTNVMDLQLLMTD